MEHWEAQAGSVHELLAGILSHWAFHLHGVLRACILLT